MPIGADEGTHRAQPNAPPEPSPACRHPLPREGAFTSQVTYLVLLAASSGTNGKVGARRDNQIKNSPIKINGID